jgi:hypothetical protein
MEINGILYGWFALKRLSMKRPTPKRPKIKYPTTAVLKTEDEGLISFQSQAINDF